MGSGISSLTWLPSRVDDKTCRDVARDMGVPFDENAFKLLVGRDGCIGRDQLERWTKDLQEVEKNYFQEELQCLNRLEFLKKFRPFVEEGRKDPSKFKGAALALSAAAGMLRAHKVLPTWINSWLDSHGFDSTDLRRSSIMEGWRVVTPLAEACYTGNVAVCAWLFSHGAQSDARGSNNFNGYTPMLLACLAGHINILEVSLLLF